MAGAKGESELRVTLFPRIAPDVVKKLEAAFQARYGIKTTLSADLTGSYSEKAAQGVIEYKSGARASYDAMVLPEQAFAALDAAKALEPIDGWDGMLPEGANKTVSPGPIAGRGFVTYDQFWGYSYNPEKITKAELPTTLAAAADPKYAGKLAISDFATNWTYALLVYTPEQFLKFASGFGSNKAVMLHPIQMAQHLALGEYAVGLFQSTEQVIAVNQKGPKIEGSLWRDVVPRGVLLYAVRKGSRAPNAAKLFTLWMTGREAVILSGEAIDLGNALYPGTQAIDQAMSMAKEIGAKPVSFFDSDEQYAKLNWLSTKAGSDYTRDLTNAIRGQ
jgi:ABC-type Fe3+ transport system substrate-binding protein